MGWNWTRTIGKFSLLSYIFSAEYRIEISLDKAGLSPFDKCSGNEDGLWLHGNQLSSNYKQDNNFASMLELWGGYKSWQESWRWEWYRGGEEGAFLISKLLYLDYWLFKVYQIAFPNHCTLRMFDLHDEQMISFSWNHSSKTLQHELWRDAVDLAVWEAAGPPSNAHQHGQEPTWE